MSLKSRVSLILDKHNISDGDSFFCSRHGNSNVKRRYVYEDGLIKTVSGLEIRPTTVRNLLNYYTIEKE